MRSSSQLRDGSGDHHGAWNTSSWHTVGAPSYSPKERKKEGKQREEGIRVSKPLQTRIPGSEPQADVTSRTSLSPLGLQGHFISSEPLQALMQRGVDTILEMPTNSEPAFRISERAGPPTEPTRSSHGLLSPEKLPLSPPRHQSRKGHIKPQLKAHLCPVPSHNNSQVPLICIFNQSTSVPTQKSHLHPPCRAPDCYINLPFVPS